MGPGARWHVCGTAIHEEFSLILQAYRRLFGPADRPPNPAYDILILGLSGAGKSAIVKILLGESLDDLQPTTGPLSLSLLSNGQDS